MDARVDEQPISTKEPGVVAAGVYAGGRNVKYITIDEIGEWFGKVGHVVWVGLYEPSEDVLGRVQKQLGLHDLAIEDASQPHQHPKIEQYGDGLFIVARTAQIVEGEIGFGETHLFVGPGYVVSVRHGASASYQAVRIRCESCPRALAHGEDYILYATLDFIVDNYMPVVESIHREVDQIEDDVFTNSVEQKDIQRLYRLRRDLLRLRNAIAPLGDVCRRLEHIDIGVIDREVQIYFRDVNDHVRRVQEEIDSLREVLTFAFEAALMAGQSEQNVITRKLAAWAAMLAVPTAIAGIYGMNFEKMPELKTEYGYFVVLAVIATLCSLLFVKLKRDKWL
ncbi:magnesium transport protein CorA [Variibacter gotjawalensis]|uniref:Magnesium transport protein CorA n=1 Tax=Variibacter gotjawalensis TaxID=1333996 RepID=A0A0S3PXN7_9BRAD|nr:magnesium and cobalt transport protein CorA [Variibacter gotjawalensis]NIK46546.1 magnesium transporter [Variibacter gotjawalensis]RZS48451.1 magnesium transporter [Variibacter gotjawalensis]BAT60712.1 magnesium transport protein CorA [Variibacter gotjawalensis]